LKRWLIIAICLLTSPAFATPLPNPLTLTRALSFATGNHPDLFFADAQLATAVADKLAIESINNIEAYIELAPRTVLPGTGSQFISGSYARLSISKTLYDFGYSQSLENSAQEVIISEKLRVQDSRNQHYLKIMQLYFNVILADLYYASVNEKVSSLYVSYDKLIERNTLGMVSDVILQEARTAYLKMANLRIESEKNQQSSRQQLAIALNQPESLPVDLVKPDLPELEKPVPELDTLLTTAIDNNLTIASLKHTITATKVELEAANQQYGPTLNADLKWNKYEREFTGRNQAVIGVSLRIPLANGRRTDATKALAIARLASARAQYDSAVLALRQQLSDLINKLDILKFKRNTDLQRLDSRGLRLEKSRALYELEMQTSLGNTMANYTEAEWISAKNDFQVALTWAQINSLMGNKLYQSKDKMP